MIDLYLSEPFVPFTLSLALLFGLLALELVLVFFGATMLGLGGDVDADVDLDMPDLADLDIDLGDADPDFFDFGDPQGGAPTAAPGIVPASWLGMGKMPSLIWLASVLLAFGLIGIVAQTIAITAISTPLPGIFVAGPAAAGAIWFARQFGSFFARLLPKTETTALSARHLGRRTGVITQGTARRGKPTEVRVTDRFGNTHYIRGEPLKDDDLIPAGTEVLVLRHRYETGYRLVPLGTNF